MSKAGLPSTQLRPGKTRLYIRFERPASTSGQIGIGDGI